jgi:hypothetical protein
MPNKKNKNSLCILLQLRIEFDDLKKKMIDSFGNMATKKLQKTLIFRQFAKRLCQNTQKKSTCYLLAGN